MVCITDKPGDATFDVRCYQESFIPVVYRAFQLGYSVSGEKVEAEIKAGKLQITNQPTAGIDAWARPMVMIPQRTRLILRLNAGSPSIFHFARQVKLVCRTKQKFRPTYD